MLTVTCTAEWHIFFLNYFNCNMPAYYGIYGCHYIPVFTVSYWEHNTKNPIVALSESKHCYSINPQTKLYIKCSKLTCVCVCVFCSNMFPNKSVTAVLSVLNKPRRKQLLRHYRSRTQSNAHHTLLVMVWALSQC